MKYTNYLISISILSLVVAGTGARAETTPEFEVFQQAMEKNFAAGEISELGDLYTENAVMLPPSSEILSSQEAIQRYWNDLREIGVYDYSIYAVEQNIDGNVAYTTALWEAKRKTANGEDITFDGNISNVYEKQNDGSWKIKLQSWN